MARILHLIDTSSAAYAGSYNKNCFISGPVVRTADGYRERIIPMGGVSQCFNIIYEHMNTGTIVFCMDSSPTIKRGMFTDYKTTRKKNELANMSKDVVEFVMRDCGFIILKEEGYEADDLVYSCVKKFKNQYDHIYIHTGDSDLYMLVEKSVSILPTSTQAKTVTLENFEYTVKKNQVVKYNTITFQKILDGDPSKAVPSLPRETKQKLARLFGTEFYQRLMGNKEIMRPLVEIAVPEALKQFDLTYPLDAPVPEELLDTSNKRRVQGWASEIRHRKINGKKMDLSYEIDTMLSEGLYIE